MSDGPGITRIRHELRRRDLDVVRIETPAPHLVRVVLGGAELEGFTSLGFDDHVKLIFAGGDPPLMRDFTPRRYDPRASELWIDFVVHAAGPATEWATQAKTGQRLRVAGPKGSVVIPAERIGHHLFVGDETAIPAIARRLEELPDEASATVLIEAGSDWRNAPLFERRERFTVQWVDRSEAGPPAAPVLAALRDHDLTASATFAWVAGESQFARAIRRHLVDERGIPKGWVKAAGYWQRGHAGAHENLSDASERIVA